MEPAGLGGPKPHDWRVSRPVGWEALEQWGDDVARIERLAGGVAPAEQALNLGLVDEVCISQVPVLFGTGIRYFGELVGAT